MDKLFSDFGINWTSIIFYTINFLVLLFLLKLFLFKPIGKVLDERKKMSKEIVDNLKKSKEDLDSLEQRIQENLKKSSIESQIIIDNAKKTAVEITDKASNDAQVKAEKLLETAHRQIEEEKDQMVKEIKSEVLEEAKVLFKQFVGTMPTSEQQKLVEDSIRKA